MGEWREVWRMDDDSVVAEIAAPSYSSTGAALWIVRTRDPLDPNDDAPHTYWTLDDLSELLDAVRAAAAG